MAYLLLILCIIPVLTQAAASGSARKRTSSISIDIIEEGPNTPEHISDSEETDKALEIITQADEMSHLLACSKNSELKQLGRSISSGSNKLINAITSCDMQELRRTRSQLEALLAFKTQS